MIKNKIRPTDILLKLVLDKIKASEIYNSYKSFGMCNIINNLYILGFINIYEHKTLLNYLNNNKSKHVKSLNVFWWDCKNAYIRIQWLEEQIKKIRDGN